MRQRATASVLIPIPGRLADGALHLTRRPHRRASAIEIPAGEAHVRADRLPLILRSASMDCVSWKSLAR